jgi:tRNA(Ile)-lysidine synthase
VVAGFKNHSDDQVTLPLSMHILIAVSGGCDSMALAQLMIKYGRRVGAVSQIRLVHVNHGWRGNESDGDEAFVKAFGKRWGVPVSVVRVKRKTSEVGEGSLEELARNRRKRIFERLAAKYGTTGRPAWILTAHHADDLAETLVWRLFTGTVSTHGAGIVFRHQQELRPFLSIRKRELAAFLKEEKQSWREDRTNFEGRFLRSRMRLELMPLIEKFFPRAVEHLVELGLKASSNTTNLSGGSSFNSSGNSSGSSSSSGDPSILFSAAGIKPRRAHWRWLNDDQSQSGQLSLPGGWILRRDRGRDKDRWILEKTGK